MKKHILILLVVLGVNANVYADNRVDIIDSEMVAQLSLSDSQANSYSSVMQKQRSTLTALQPQQWREKVVVYEETVIQLKDVLDNRQLARFVAVISCQIEKVSGEGEMMALAFNH